MGGKTTLVKVLERKFETGGKGERGERTSPREAGLTGENEDNQQRIERQRFDKGQTDQHR
jgi:hypothetical protein